MLNKKQHHRCANKNAALKLENRCNCHDQNLKYGKIAALYIENIMTESKAELNEAAKLCNNDFVVLSNILMIIRCYYFTSCTYHYYFFLCVCLFIVICVSKAIECVFKHFIPIITPMMFIPIHLFLLYIYILLLLFILYTFAIVSQEKRNT